MSSIRQFGVVDRFFQEKGYGWFKPDTGQPDLWFHQSGQHQVTARIESVQFIPMLLPSPVPSEGDRVVFISTTDKKDRPKAFPWAFRKDYEAALAMIGSDLQNIAVRFCPCGHSANLTRQAIEEMGFAEQLAQIADGEKSDTVALDDSLCPQCHPRHDDRSSWRSVSEATARNRVFRQGKALLPPQATQMGSGLDVEEAIVIAAKHLAWVCRTPHSVCLPEAKTLIDACHKDTSAISSTLNSLGFDALGHQEGAWERLLDKYEQMRIIPPSDSTAAFKQAEQLELKGQYSDASRKLSYAIAVVRRALILAGVR